MICAMETLRAYLNSLSMREKIAYAKRCGSTLGYLRKAISLNTRLDGALVRRLDEESRGAVPRTSLRPDIWPEALKSSKAKAA